MWVLIHICNMLMQHEELQVCDKEAAYKKNLTCASDPGLQGIIGIVLFPLCAFVVLHTLWKLLTEMPLHRLGQTFMKSWCLLEGEFCAIHFIVISSW